MAYTDIVAATAAMNVVQDTALQTAIPIKNSAGAAVDCSAFIAFKLSVFPPGGSGSASIPLSSTSAVVGTSTGITVKLTAAQSNGLQPGVYNAIAEGQPASGDDFQALANITLNVLRAA